MIQRLKSVILVLTFSVIPIALLSLSCSESSKSPRETVLDFVRMVQTDTLPDVIYYFDLDQVAANEYADDKYDSLSLQMKKDLLVQSFLRDGAYRQIFERSQIVVNREQLLNDTTATVEVSYIDRRTRIQYYTMMGLIKRVDHWVIYSLEIK